MRIHPQVKNQDLPELPEEMQDDFRDIFVPILSTDPYNCGGFPSHDLVRDLKGLRALEIELDIEGYKEVYRLIYRINNIPKNKSVEIISIDLHDSAYDKAHERVVRR